MKSRINKPDTRADIRLREALDQRQSFIMISGAGSGKTTSLVKALSHTIVSRGKEFRKWGRKVACITYTEIAATEISNDVGNNPLAHVSTIHSFLWSLISPFQKDIRKWVAAKIEADILALEHEAANFPPRTRQATKDKNLRKVEKLRGHAENLPTAFNYTSGKNYTRGILGHDDIVAMVPALIIERPLLRAIIAQSFPVVFIDESQDTLPIVIEAFKAISRENANFIVGFFGDPMQKIYLHGIGQIQQEDNWIRIEKPENFRCSTSVINVINQIRLEDDRLQQEPGPLNREQAGSARLFILPADDRRTERLQRVKEFISRENNDPVWATDDVKLLVIVHRMAAIRLGFASLYAALNDRSPEEFKSGVTDGTAWPLRPFLKFVLPLIAAHQTGKNFDVVAVLREYSPLFKKEAFQNIDAAGHLRALKDKIDTLSNMFRDNRNVEDALRFVNESGLYVLDTRFNEFLNPDEVVEGDDQEAVEEDGNEDKKRASMQAFFACPLSDFLGYQKYIAEESPFATQHGVKGTEFNRVITVCDDEEGRYFLYSYDKYFGMRELSEDDLANQAEGNDSVIERTRRLFYVCCSRAEKDLAVVYFVANPVEAVEAVRQKGYFADGQIFTLAQLEN